MWLASMTQSDQPELVELSSPRVDGPIELVGVVLVFFFLLSFILVMTFQGHNLVFLSSISIKTHSLSVVRSIKKNVICNKLCVMY